MEPCSYSALLFRGNGHLHPGPAEAEQHPHSALATPRQHGHHPSQSHDDFHGPLYADAPENDADRTPAGRILRVQGHARPVGARLFTHAPVFYPALGPLR